MGSSKKHKEKEKERDREVRKRHRSRSRDRTDRHRREARQERRDRSRSKEREKARKGREYEEKTEKVRTKEEKYDSDSEVRSSNAGGESSMSIEDTNKLRAKLGLKPLDVPSKTKSEDDEFKGDKEFVHKPPENWGDKKYMETLREKIAVQKERRKIQEKLKKVKGLADSDSEDEIALDWVMKSRKLEEEKAKAEKTAKLLQQMDEEFGIGNLIEDEFKKIKDQAYTGRDLAGMTVEHGQERFVEGRDIILTLKDKNVLDEESDVLVNVNLIDNEKAEKNTELKKKKPGYDAYEEPLDEFGNLLAKKPVLKKYDEEIDGAKKDTFKLDSGGNVDMEKQRQLLEIRKKLHMRNTESLSMPEPRIAAEFLSKDEMVKFKKPKKVIRKVRKQKQFKADELATLATQSSTKGTDFGSRTVKKEPIDPSSDSENSRDVSVKDEPEDSMDVDDWLYQEDTDYLGPDEDLSHVVVEPDEAELELQIALNKARKLKQRQEENSKDFHKLAVKIESTMDEDSDDPHAKGPKGSIVMNSTAEFCRALGDIPTYGLSGNRDEDVDELMEFDRDANQLDDNRHLEDENKEYTGGWNEVGIDEKPVEVKTEDVPILEEEPDVSVGLAGALKLAMKKGYLEKESKKMASAPRHSQLQAANYTIEDKSFVEDDKYGRRDRYCAGPVTDFKERDLYKPDVKLEYIDDNGRLLTPKEAFRYLSHKFHGKGSGKNKTEKRMKKLQEEVLMKQMSSTDTPLGTLALLQEKQKQTQSPYILLSGGSKALNPNAISKPV